jgi:hypothetical protein
MRRSQEMGLRLAGLVQLLPQPLNLAVGHAQSGDPLALDSRASRKPDLDLDGAHNVTWRVSATFTPSTRTTLSPWSAPAFVAFWRVVGALVGCGAAAAVARASRAAQCLQIGSGRSRFSSSGVAERI